MYETQELTFEASVQVPIVQEIDRGPEIDWGITLGVRVSF
jgi:hypothetical protein